MKGNIQIALMEARADLCREWLAQKKEIAQLRELVKEAGELMRGERDGINPWLAKAEKLMEGK
jgi:hypothetical protein